MPEKNGFKNIEVYHRNVSIFNHHFKGKNKHTSFWLNLFNISTTLNDTQCVTEINRIKFKETEMSQAYQVLQ